MTDPVITETETDYASAVALIGMSGRFPGANNVGELWRNVVAGVKGLREITEDELAEAGIDPGQLADPRYVRIGGPLEGIDMFDASVFGINPREAETMDPQHRLFLECSWEALEAAGYCPTDTPGQVGIFGGCGFPDYMVKNAQSTLAEPGGALLMAVGNERDSLAPLVAYKLGLRGPSISIQTFCSTSLVAVHLGVQSLLTYECDIALAGGVFTPLPQHQGYLYEQGGILSPDGKVRSFDAQANGAVMGNGVAIVALKRMSEAIEDGDIIHAVILGSAVNNDGRLRAGFTAPGVEGQSQVIEAAIGVAGIKPETVGYIECHATGTMLGDSIELAAISRVFTNPPETPCVLGTLKPSIGHLDRASGATGLIRAALNLKHELLPATPNYESPNPALASASDRFTVLNEHRHWEQGSHPRRAGVNSFGLGGTNAHVVLEQAPELPATPERPGPHLLLYSGGDEQALAELTAQLRKHLQDNPTARIDDVAYTLQVSRGGFALRRAIVANDLEDAIAALDDENRWIGGKTQRRNPRVHLVAPENAEGATVPEGWWPQLHAAVTEATGAGGAGKSSTAGAKQPAGHDGALAALADGLTKIGVRVLAADAAKPADLVKVTVAPADGESAAQWLLATIAKLWLAGSTIDWAALHQGNGRRVELPTYPFQKRRYWLKAPAAGVVPTAVSTGRTYDRSRWTYLPTWRQRPLAVDSLDEQLREAGPWLVFSDDERGEALIERLVRAGAEVAAVRGGSEFAQDDDGNFTVSVTSPDDIADVLYSLPVAPRAIVHGFSLAGSQADPAGDPIAHFDTEQRRGFYSVLALARELVDSTGAAPRCELVLLTSGAVSVVGSDLTHPEHSTIASLPPSLAQENPRVRSRSIDCDPVPAGDAAALEQLATQVLAASVCDYQGPAAVRGGETWQRHYEQLPTADVTGQPPFNQGDTVLITGGLGDVGLTIGRHLASRYGCKLVLTARSELPPREEWAVYVEQALKTGGDRIARHIANIQDLEARGAEVIAVSADVADEAQMQAVVDAAIERFGGIDVVLHGAGVQDSAFFNFAHLMDKNQCNAHFASKVKGFLVLQKVLGEHAKDRRITMSSLAAVLGGITLAPYASANAALDAYIRVARRDGEGRWITIDWDTWNITAERVDGHSAAITDFAMAPAEGVDIFERALGAAHQVGHLVISTGSLDARIDQWVIGDIHGTDDDDDDREKHPRPELNTPFVEPKEGTEATLAAIWSRVLGIEPIGANDNFFELGGHSLIAIELTNRIRKSLAANVPVTGLLECPTIRELAQLIDGEQVV
ncbi:MAG TPA: SDR family NAD(P)-dependent oxidoreductase [Pseudonocardiaceae bacterium]|nr:SDR family NAD(P)-dependent oxidoreductase [Pseudonocardiaceae bacterium]